LTPHAAIQDSRRSRAGARCSASRISCRSGAADGRLPRSGCYRFEFGPACVGSFAGDPPEKVVRRVEDANLHSDASLGASGAGIDAELGICALGSVDDCPCDGVLDEVCPPPGYAVGGSAALLLIRHGTHPPPARTSRWPWRREGSRMTDRQMRHILASTRPALAETLSAAQPEGSFGDHTRHGTAD
jgi:hypothetical protein